MVKSIAKCQYAPRQATYKNVKTNETTFTSPNPCFEGRRDGDSTPACHEILLIDEPTEQHQPPSIEELSTQEDSSTCL